MKMKLKKPKRMCAWCGKKEAKFAGIRKHPTWCSKACMDNDLDNNLLQETGIDLKPIRDEIRARRVV